MAKHKRSPLRTADGGKPSTAVHCTETTLRQASTHNHPSRSRGRKPFFSARLNNKSNSCAPPSNELRPTLADRFHGLPGELRSYIFSLLLVQPCKWSIEHCSGCPESCNSTWTHVSRPKCSHHDCPHNHWVDAPPGTSKQLFDDVNPWRSRFAPKPQNPYICSDCWDLHHRPGCFPRLKSLPCLCARRQNLEALLVCRKWYSEAGRVLYKQNIFAFEGSSTLLGFASQMSMGWTENITKVSLMAWYHHSAQSQVDNGALESPKKLAQAWKVLARLLSMRQLELDALFLTRLKDVRRLMGLRLEGVSTSFVLRRPKQASTSRTGSPEVWPHFYYRILLRGGLAEEIARCANGERRAWLKVGKKLRAQRLKTAVQRQATLTEHFSVCSVIWQDRHYEVSSERGRVVYCGDEQDWFDPGRTICACNVT